MADYVPIARHKIGCNSLGNNFHSAYHKNESPALNLVGKKLYFGEAFDNEFDSRVDLGKVVIPKGVTQKDILHREISTYGPLERFFTLFIDDIPIAEGDETLSIDDFTPRHYVLDAPFSIYGQAIEGSGSNFAHLIIYGKTQKNPKVIHTGEESLSVSATALGEAIDDIVGLEVEDNSIVTNSEIYLVGKLYSTEGVDDENLWSEYGLTTAHILGLDVDFFIREKRERIGQKIFVFNEDLKANITPELISHLVNKLRH